MNHPQPLTIRVDGKEEFRGTALLEFTSDGRIVNAEPIELRVAHRLRGPMTIEIFGRVIPVQPAIWDFRRGDTVTIQSFELEVTPPQ